MTAMDFTEHRRRLCGCYTTIPTPFRDDDLELNLPALKRHVEFLIQGGIREGTGVLLAAGAAGDFSTMSIDERIRVAEAVIEAADGRVPVAVGAQTTSTRELVTLAQAAQRLGADYIQISPPFYFDHTQQDFIDYFLAAAEAAQIGLILYNTYWSSLGVSLKTLDSLIGTPNFVGLKWATPDGGYMEFEAVVSEFSDRVSVIDNQNRYIISHILGAHAIEFHICNHWPQFSVKIWRWLEEGRYAEVQRELVRVLLPYYALWSEMETYTSGDGYLDKLCMELVGLDSSRSRPPTRDVRQRFREKARRMLIDCQTPGVIRVGSKPR